MYNNFAEREREEIKIREGIKREDVAIIRQRERFLKSNL